MKKKRVELGREHANFKLDEASSGFALNYPRDYLAVNTTLS